MNEIIEYQRALQAIAGMSIDGETDFEALSALCIAIARVTLKRVNDAWEAECAAAVTKSQR